MALPLPMAPAPRTTGMRTPLFLLGVGMALIAFIAMFAFGIIFANHSLPGSQVAVVVAAEDIPAREQITPSMLTVTNVPQSLLPPHAYTRLADPLGYSALVPIFKGQAITANVVSTNRDLINSSQLSYLPIPQGFVAITIPTSELQGVAGYVVPGDFIDIIATANSDLFFSKPSRFTTRTVFTDVKVIRVGPPTGAPGPNQAIGVTASLTVIVTQCDAAYLEWLMANVTLKYVLLSNKDYGNDAPVTSQPNCPADTAPPVVGPAAVNARWNFTKD